jgi:hypothetical protein
MMSADPTPLIAALDIQPTYSAREAAAILGRSYSWLDQRLRKGQFTLPDGTVLEPLRTAGGYRRFTTEMLRDIATSSYRQHWFSMEEVKLTFFELAMAAATGAITRCRTERPRGVSLAGGSVPRSETCCATGKNQQAQVNATTNPVHIAL